MPASSRSLPLVALALGVAILVVQIRVIAGGHSWDDVRYHTEVAPPRLAAGQAIQRGALPAWWDGSGLGVTLAGEPGHAALYPLHYLTATPRALDLMIVVHLAWAALGVAVWSRRRASDRSALVAGVLVVTTGIVMSAALRGALPGLAHLPWLGAAVGSLGRATDRRTRARASCSIAALIAAIGLAGELALVIDAIAIALALGLTRATWRWLAAGVAAGLAIAALQWLPALLALGDRAGAEVAGLPLARLIELVVPGAFGADAAERAIPAVAGGAPWAPSLFVGAPLIALACVRPPSRRMLGLICGLGAAALVTGRGGWPAWLGAPELQVAVLAIVLAVAAADGLDALALGRRRAVLAVAFGVGFTAAGLAALAVLRTRQGELAPAIDRALLDGGIGVACMAAGVALAWRAPGRQIAVLCGLLVAPGVGAAHSLAPTVDRAVVSEPPAWAELAQQAPRPIRVYRPVGLADHRSLEPRPGANLGARPSASSGTSSGTSSGASPGSRLGDELATFAGSSGWRWGIGAARSEDPARAAVHDQVWLAAAHEGGALLDRFGISLAIVPSTLIAPRKLTALDQRGSWALVTLPVAPAAAVMRGWLWAAEPADALALLFPQGGGTGVLRGTTVLAGAGPAGPPSREPLPCTIRSWTDGDIELACSADSAGYAVVSSAAATGWQVEVDGAPAAWLTADVLRRAVAVPAGTHRVHWTYSLPGLSAGAAIALAGGLAVIALWLLGRRQRKVDGELMN